MTRGNADGEHHEKSEAKGPHGGTVFKEGYFSLEALLSEDGGEPRLRIWLSDKDKSRPLNAATVTATVTRPTDEKQKLTFAAEKDSLVSREIVAEPHAFDIEIIAQTATEPFMFVMSKEEGKIELTDAQIKAASISLDAAVKANIKTALLLPGEIRLNEDRHVSRCSPACGSRGKRQCQLGPSGQERASFGGDREPDCFRATQRAADGPKALNAGKDHLRARKKACGSRRSLPSRTTCRPSRP